MIPEDAGRKTAAAVVACGGVGARFAGPGVDDGIVAKQFFPVAGKPILGHTLSTLEIHGRIEAVVLVLPEHLLTEGEALVGRERYQKVVKVLPGGKERQQSVAAGLEALAELGWQGPVLVQDGVRPCTAAEVYDRVIDGVYASGNSVAAIPLRDSLKRTDGSGHVQESLDRRDLWQIQTPQGFWLNELRAAYREGEKRGLRAADDAALMEAAGRTVFLVQGDPGNIKLTYPDDLPLIEACLLSQRNVSDMLHVGIGFDAHQLAEGQPLMLGGVRVPWPKGLAGHSDGDVLLHAVIDALLGAAGLSDIGVHFPDNDPKYKGCSSLLLLSATQDILRQAGFVVSNVDCTLVAQRPKIQPYIPEMRKAISRALGAEEGRVSVKATTTEHMGFTGREEGISCYAVCTIAPGKR